MFNVVIEVLRYKFRLSDMRYNFMSRNLKHNFTVSLIKKPQVSGVFDFTFDNSFA